MLKWVLTAVGTLILLISVPAYLLRDNTSIGRVTPAEITLFTTSTNANYAGLPVINVNDFDTIAYTVSSQNASGTLRFICSTQDTEITTAVSSTSNRWDYVDVVDTEDETSIDGDTGVVMVTSTDVRTFVVRNAVYRWCSAIISGDTSPSGLGTTTVYMKRVQNQ